MKPIIGITLVIFLLISCKGKKGKDSSDEVDKYEKELADIKQNVDSIKENYSMDSSQIEWEGTMRRLYYQLGYDKNKTEQEIVKKSDSIWLEPKQSKKWKDWYLRFRKRYHPNIK